MLTYVHQIIYVENFKIEFFIITLNWKKLKCPSTVEWAKHMMFDEMNHVSVEKITATCSNMAVFPKDNIE